MAKVSLDRLEAVNLAESNGSDAAARRRLTNDRKPSHAQSSGGSWVNWGLDGEVLGQPFDMVRIPLSKLEQMRRDPMLSFGLAFVKVPLIRAPWYIKCSDPRIASAVENALRPIYGRFIMAYTNSFDYGFSPMVKRFQLESPDWTYIKSADEPSARVWADGYPQMVTWKPFTSLNPRQCVPHWSAKGEFNGIDFSSDPAGIGLPFFNSGTNINMGGGDKRQADIPRDWALWSTNEKDGVFGSYWGYPRIGYAYRYWWAYWYRFGLADRAFERWADPPIMAFHPAELATDEDGNPIDFSSEALATAEKLRSGANISLPSSVIMSYDERASNVREWWMEQMKSETNWEALNAAFEYLDVQKLRAVMVPEQALVEGKGGTSSRNVAATFGDIFQESQAVAKLEIDDHINRFVIPQFVELNFGPNAAKAEIVTTGFDPGDIETMRAVVQAVSNKEGSAPLSAIDFRELMERLGIPLLSHDAALAAQEKAAAEQEKEATDSHQRQLEIKSIPGKQSGRTDLGEYYAPRERVDLGEMVMVERSEGFADAHGGVTAMFSAEDRTLYVDKDADLDEVRGWLVKGKEEVAKETNLSENEQESNLKLADVLISRIERMQEQIDKPPVIVIPEHKPRKTRKSIEWDEQNRIVSVNTVELDEHDTDDDSIKTDDQGRIVEITVDGEE